MPMQLINAGSTYGDDPCGGIMILAHSRGVKVNTKMHKKGLLKMSFSGTNFVLVVLKELSTYPWFYMTFL